MIVAKILWNTRSMTGICITWYGVAVPWPGLAWPGQGTATGIWVWPSIVVLARVLQQNFHCHECFPIILALHKHTFGKELNQYFIPWVLNAFWLVFCTELWDRYNSHTCVLCVWIKTKWSWKKSSNLVWTKSSWNILTTSTSKETAPRMKPADHSDTKEGMRKSIQHLPDFRHRLQVARKAFV